MWKSGSFDAGEDPERKVGDVLREKGLDLRFVKFGRLPGLPEGTDPFELTVGEFRHLRVAGAALDAADMWFVGVVQQYERASNPAIPMGFEDEYTYPDVLRFRADVEIFPALLQRLRRAVVLVKNHVEGGEELREALATFDAAVPHLKYLRDSAEHFDDYILGKGHQEPRYSTGTEVREKEKAPSVHRGGRSIDLETAMHAARDLYTQLYLITEGRAPFFLDDREDVESTDISDSEPA